MNNYLEVQRIMIVKRITISFFLFIFGIVNQVWADPVGRLNDNFYEERSSDDNKFGVKSFLESLRENKTLKLIESIDRWLPLYKLGETAWRYKCLDLQGIEETKSLNSEDGQSSLKLHPNVNRYFEESGAKVTFELLQAKVKRGEIFILFHLSFNPIQEQKFLEMHLNPYFGRGANVFIPF
jgi:hypothetical protein